MLAWPSGCCVCRLLHHRGRNFFRTAIPRFVRRETESVPDYSSARTENYKLPPSNNKHTVAVAVKTITLFDGVAISVQHEIAIRSEEHQQQQRGLRQVKISQQSVNRSKLVPGNNCQIRRSRLRSNLAVRIDC